MIVHVHISYTEAQNPLTTQEGTQALSDFISYMETQTDFPDVEPVFVAWQDQRPPSGYGFFKCAGKDQIRSYLERLPGKPQVKIVAVNELPDMAKRAKAHLAAF